jgi:hypothetical protein
MNREFKRHFAVACLLAAGWTAGRPLNAGTREDVPRFTVRLYNYAGVDSLQLRRGITAASRVFRRAGIQLVWVECSVTREDVRKDSACGQFDGTPWAQLTILPEKMAQRFEFDHEAFGVAFGCLASVFFDRVQELSGQMRIPESLVLGHIMAHELGHVLLGPASHSSNGVMIANVKRTDLPKVVKGWLAFDSEQAARMQAHLRQPAVAISSALAGGSASARAGEDCLDAAPAASPLR